MEDKKVVSVQDGSSYFDQARQYAAGEAKRLAVVVVLDCAEKTQPPPGLANDIAFAVVQAGDQFRFGLGTVVVRGRLPRPSDHSR